MKLKMVLFDLDGTLLPMDQNTFTRAYFGGLAKKLAPLGYEKDALVSAIWAGSQAMVENDGQKSNEEVFWDSFSAVLGNRVRDDYQSFEEYYRDDFDKVKEVCGYTPSAKAAVMEFKNMGLRVALATNPLFPTEATERRISWTGLSPSDFELFTTYENSKFCKPNLSYYKSILEKLGVKAEECLMVGNDVGEDMIAKELGMDVFLVTDCLINKENKDISEFPNGDLDELIRYVKNKEN